MKSESLGGVADAVDAPVALPKRVLDVHALDGVERSGGDRFSFAQAIAERRIELQGVAGGSNQRALDGVFQLTHVARPVVPDERAHHLVGYSGDAALQFSLMVVDEEPHQRGDVFSTFAHWRHLDRKHAESIVEIGPELPFRHRRLQIMMRRRDDADVGASRA